MVFSGKDELGERMEIAELGEAQHPYYIGVQFHPEFKSKPFTPSPVFYGLIQAASEGLSRESPINVRTVYFSSQPNDE